MSGPRFLTVAQVELLHQKLIDLFGGAHGLRDPILLEGAVIHPQNIYHYAQCDLFDVAAAYAFHIAQAQAFTDGNKRIGIAAALAFLDGNGIPLQPDTARLYEAMLALAEGHMNKAELATVLTQLAAK